MNIKILSYAILCILVFFFSLPAYAKIKTFIKEYTYQASEADSKLSSRTIALEQVKKILLEEIGVYIISETQAANAQLTKDKITALTAGIVKTEILSETWDGHKYYLKAIITADPSEVSKAVQQLGNDRKQSEELESAQRQVTEALKEIERLKIELSVAKDDKQKQIEYTKSVNVLSANDWYQKGYKAERNKNWSEAISDFSHAIELNPNNIANYYHRGWLYGELNNYYLAIRDYSKAIELLEEEIKNDEEMRRMYSDTRIREAYENVGGAIFGGLFDFKKGSFLETVYPIEEHKAFLGENYFNRGVMYSKLRNNQQTISDFRNAALLGNNSAQNALRQQGIGW